MASKSYTIFVDSRKNIRRSFASSLARDKRPFRVVTSRACSNNLAGKASAEGRSTSRERGDDGTDLSPSRDSRPHRSHALLTVRQRERWTLIAEAGLSVVDVMLNVMPAAADEIYVVKAGAEPPAVKLATLHRLQLRRKN